MQERNAPFNTLPPNRMVAHRFSQSPGPPATSSAPSAPLGLRTFRHPVPTSRGRTSFAEKLDVVANAPKIMMPPIPGDTPPTQAPANDPEKNKTEESIIENRPKTPMATRLLKTNSEPPMPIKHNLPCTVFPHKGSYIRKPTFVIKEKTRSQTTAELETQTENYFKTEEEIHILDIVKDSGLSSEELQNRLADNMQEKEKNSDDKSITTIDLEDDSEDANDLYAKVMKHSTNNKLVLNKIAKIFQKSKPSLPSFDPNPPSTSPTAEPCRALVERPTASPISAAGELADTLKPTIDDLQKGLVFSVMLQQMGFRLVRTEPQTQATQTEENRGNIRKRRRVFAKDDNQSVNELMGHFEQNIQRTPVAPVRPSHELSALAPEVQDVAVFQAHNSPRQQQPQQTPPHYVSEHERPSQYYPHMSALMSPQEQQRAQNTAPRSSHLSSTAAHNPFEQNQNNNTFSTSQSPVQMQNQVQRYPSQRRQSVHGPPHLSRVMSTQEANMHGSQAQQPSWGYPPYYEQNVYSQRHQ